MFFFLVTLSFLGEERSKLLFLVPALRQNIENSLTLHKNFFSCFGFYKLGVDCFTGILIYCNNRSVIQIGRNDAFHEHTKQIEIDCHFIRHHLLQGTLQIQSVSSKDQLVDIFTKPPRQVTSALQTQVGRASPNVSLKGLLTYKPNVPLLILLVLGLFVKRS